MRCGAAGFHCIVAAVYHSIPGVLHAAANADVFPNDFVYTYVKPNYPQCIKKDTQSLHSVTLSQIKVYMESLIILLQWISNESKKIFSV